MSDLEQARVQAIHAIEWFGATADADASQKARAATRLALDALIAAAKREGVREAVERLTLRDYGALVDTLERELALDRTKNGHTVVLRNRLLNALAEEGTP